MKISPLSTNCVLASLLIGFSSITQAVSPAPDGSYSGANTAEGGSGALFSLTTGTNNTAIGNEALFSVTTSVQNTATGAQALKNNTANQNTADGFQALVNNTTGPNNTAIGWRALFRNTTGSTSTAVGYGALYKVGDGADNTAVGFEAQYFSDGLANTSIGSRALYHNGNDGNTAVGVQALFNNNAGNNNIALGSQAGFNITDGSDNIDLGNEGVAGDSNTIRIGTIGGADGQTAAYIAGIDGQTVDPCCGTTVFVDQNGKLGTVVSSKRFKDEIKAMDKTSEAILRLQPVTFRYKKELDPKGVQQFGLVAEDVAKVNPDLVIRDRDGKLQTVRYEAVNAMLLNEFLKEHQKVEEQGVIIAKQQKQIDALVSGLQKVNAQIEASRSAPQMVATNQ